MVQEPFATLKSGRLYLKYASIRFELERLISGTFSTAQSNQFALTFALNYSGKSSHQDKGRVPLENLFISLTKDMFLDKILKIINNTKL